MTAVLVVSKNVLLTLLNDNASERLLVERNGQRIVIQHTQKRDTDRIIAVMR